MDEVVYAQVLKQFETNPQLTMFMGCVEVGIAICNAVNAAVDEGLGTCLHAFSNPDIVKEHFNVPDSWVPVWLQLVGYPLEEPEAGGQRPRRPLSHSFFIGDCNTPFEEDPEVTEYLKREGMIQAPGPFPYRDQEVRMLSRMFGLPE